MDCTFSAPKSVSLALAAGDDVKKDMIEAHQAATAKMADLIEMQYLRTRTSGNKFLSHNCVAAEFVHLTARPTEQNNFVPDLDIHSHLCFMNTTMADGDSYAQDYELITKNQKELGLLYRQQLAQELQKRGYALEVTDARQGFFELAGFDRETIEKYSHREAEILKHAEERGISTTAAILESRTAKDATRGSYQDIIRETRKDLFEGKINIERTESHERNDRTEERIREREKTPGVHGRGRREPDFEGFGGGQRREKLFETFERANSLSDLRDSPLDVPGDRVSLLLPPRSILDMASRQSRKMRDILMQREATAERRERINKIAAETIKTLSEEKFAFSVKEAEKRIMAAGVLEAISREEATKAIERAEVVKLGHIENENGKRDKNTYITTEENIAIEKNIKERMLNGKDAIESKLMTCEDVRAEIDRIEDVARAEGRTHADFSANAEQRAAVEHVLCCGDRFVGIDGLAGTGKTTGAMTRLKWIADEQGITLRGVCFTGQAALGLQTDSGIQSETIHHFLGKLERESGVTVEKPQPDEVRQKWDFSQVREIPAGHREIWIVDEAGLVNDRLMDQLQIAAEARGAQVVLMGDPLQLPPVGAGSPMKDMEEAGMATAHLNNIQRQKDETLLQAVRDSVTVDEEGKKHLKTFEALAEMGKDVDERGNYREVKDAKTRRAEIVKEVTAGPLDQYENNLLLVATNADRKAYNNAIRAEYIERGELEKGEKFKIEVQDPSGKKHEETRNFSKGDRLIFLQNESKEMNVKNGTIGTVEYINNKYIGVTIERETESGHKYIDMVEIDTEKYKKFDHAYALTEYKAQGKTVQKVVVDMNTKGSAKNRNQLYVDISRAKFEAVVYTDDKKKLEKQTERFADKVTSRDFSRRLARMEKQQGIRNNDRYHSPVESEQKRLEKHLRTIEEHTLKYAKADLERVGGKEPPQPKREPMTEREAEIERIQNATLKHAEAEQKRLAEERRERERHPQEQEREKPREKPEQEQARNLGAEVDKMQMTRIRGASARLETFAAEQEAAAARAEAAKRQAEKEALIKEAKEHLKLGKEQGLTVGHGQERGANAPQMPGADGARVRSLTPPMPGGSDGPSIGGR